MDLIQHLTPRQMTAAADFVGDDECLRITGTIYCSEMELHDALRLYQTAVARGMQD